MFRVLSGCGIRSQEDLVIGGLGDWSIRRLGVWVFGELWLLVDICRFGNLVFVALSDPDYMKFQ